MGSRIKRKEQNKKPIQKLEEDGDGWWGTVSKEWAQQQFGIIARVCLISAFKVTFSSLFPALSPQFLELRDGAFKARAMGPRINFCSWNLLDACVAREPRAPMRWGEEKERGWGAELLAYLGMPGTAQCGKFLL